MNEATELSVVVVSSASLTSPSSSPDSGGVGLMDPTLFFDGFGESPPLGERWVGVVGPTERVGVMETIRLILGGCGLMGLIPLSGVLVEDGRNPLSNTSPNARSRARSRRSAGSYILSGGVKDLMLSAGPMWKFPAPEGNNAGTE